LFGILIKIHQRRRLNKDFKVDDILDKINKKEPLTNDEKYFLKNFDKKEKYYFSCHSIGDDCLVYIASGKEIYIASTSNGTWYKREPYYVCTDSIPQFIRDLISNLPYVKECEVGDNNFIKIIGIRNNFNNIYTVTDILTNAGLTELFDKGDEEIKKTEKICKKLGISCYNCKSKNVTIDVYNDDIENGEIIHYEMNGEISSQSIYDDGTLPKL